LCQCNPRNWRGHCGKAKTFCNSHHVRINP
jgi:hypothetical protein